MIRPHVPRFLLTALAFTLLCQPAGAQTSTGYERLGRELLKELIETNTTHSSGSTTIAAETLAARFVAAGFPKADVVVVGGTSAAARTRGNLVVRYRGSGARKPVLFFAHLDVVEARREDWSMDPFVLTEKDGYFYGRGTIDVKGGAATLAAAFLRLRQESFVPDRDLILALTADEEGGDDNGMAWLLANRRDLVDAAYGMNVDTGGGEILAGKLAVLDVQASEKVFASFSLTVTNPGGHSSMPPKENAIYRLAAGLQRLAAFEFPVHLTDVTRAYFEKMAPLSGASGADMTAVARPTPDPAAAARLSAASAFHNALLRTTCVATMLRGGHAENALPQTAQATVNCRIIPGETAEAVQATLVKVLADPKITLATTSAAKRQPAVGAGGGATVGHRGGCAGDLGRGPDRADRPVHGHRRDRRPLPADGRDPGLRDHRHRLRPRRLPRPRQGRAHPRDVVQRGARLRLPDGEDDRPANAGLGALNDTPPAAQRTVGYVTPSWSR